MVCIRCGYEDASGHIAKRVERGSTQTCQSCRARPAEKVDSNYGKCRPWHGEFDEHENPVDRFGKLYKPGVRLCMNADCVEVTHIVPSHLIDPQLERHDISYRTGKKLTWLELLDKLESERP